MTKKCRPIDERKFRHKMYSHGLRMDAVLLAEQTTIAHAAEELGVAPASIARWKQAYGPAINSMN